MKGHQNEVAVTNPDDPGALADLNRLPFKHRQQPSLYRFLCLGTRVELRTRIDKFDQWQKTRYQRASGRGWHHPSTATILP